jgi:hypothetical protein
MITPTTSIMLHNKSIKSILFVSGLAPTNIVKRTIECTFDRIAGTRRVDGATFKLTSFATSRQKCHLGMLLSLATQKHVKWCTSMPKLREA